MSTYMGVTNLQKQFGFFWPTLYTSVAHAQYDWTTYIYTRGGGCVKICR